MDILALCVIERWRSTAFGWVRFSPNLRRQVGKRSLIHLENLDHEAPCVEALFAHTVLTICPRIVRKVNDSDVSDAENLEDDMDYAVKVRCRR